MSTPRELFEKRKARVRTALKNAANGKMRLSVFRSGKHIYAQIIDDAKGSTVVSASTLDKKSEIRLRNLLPLKRPALSVRWWLREPSNPVLVKLSSTEVATFITVVLKLWLTLHALPA